MNPARTAVVALAAAALLASCTSSGSPRRSGSATPSGGATSGAASGTTAPSGGTTAASGAATGQDTASLPVPAKAVRSFTVQGAHATYVFQVWAEQRASACVPYAQGAVLLAYLRSHPCLQLGRYLATTTVNGKQVGLSAAVVTYPAPTAVGTQSAGGLAAIATSRPADGFQDLFRSGHRVPSGPDRLPASRSHGARNDGVKVVVADAWYLPDRPSSGDPALTELLESLSP